MADNGNGMTLSAAGGRLCSPAMPTIPPRWTLGISEWVIHGARKCSHSGVSCDAKHLSTNFTPTILHEKKDLEIPSQGLSGPASNFIVVSCISGVVVLGEVSVDAGVLALPCNIKSLFGRGP